MGRRRKENPLSPEAPPICARINYLLTLIWAKSIARMAKALGVSQPALARVIAGQAPSWRMVESIAQLGHINMQWLLLGIGDPVIEQARSLGGRLYPVVTELLTSRPSECPGQLGHLTLPAASPHLIEDAYWYRVDQKSRIATDRHENMKFGDYLLIETSPRWTSRIEGLAGRLVVISRSRDDARGVAFLARVGMEEHFEDDSPFSLNTFGLFKSARLAKGVRSSKAEYKNAVKTIPEEDVEFFFLEDVVGVVVQLARMLEAGQ